MTLFLFGQFFFNKMNKQYCKSNYIKRLFSLSFKEQLHPIINRYTHSGNNETSYRNIKNKTNSLSFVHNKRGIQRLHQFSNMKYPYVVLTQILTIDINIFTIKFYVFIWQFLMSLIYNQIQDRIKIYTVDNRHCSITPMAKFNTTKTSKNFLEKKLSINNSIQNQFLFLENRFYSFDTQIQGKLFTCLHPEIIIRIMRKHIQDTCLIDLFRKLIYSDRLTIVQDINTKLYNLILVEADFFLNQQFNKCQIQIYTKYTLYIYEIRSSQKWRTCELTSLKSVIFAGIKAVLNQKIAKLQLCVKLKKFINVVIYLRYQFNYFFMFNGSIIKAGLFYMRFNRFLKRRLNIQINRPQLSYNCNKLSHLKWFNLSIQRQNKDIYLHLFDDKKDLKSLLYFKFNCVYISNNYILNELKLYQLCNIKGYPIAKLSWSPLSDYQIIAKFQKLYDFFFFYYSGALNSTSIQYIYHIVRYSCAKTLACKHKATLASIWTSISLKRHIHNIQHSRNFVLQKTWYVFIFLKK